jgi:hypothetical protein
LIVKFVVPPTVSVPLRAAPVFAATVKATVPLPLPVAPDEIVMKVALLVAVQAQPAGAVTGTDPVPPAAPNVVALMVPPVTVQVVVELVGVFESLLQPTPVMTSNRTVAAKNLRFKCAIRPLQMIAQQTKHASAGDRVVPADCQNVFYCRAFVPAVNLFRSLPSIPMPIYKCEAA